MSRIFLTGGTGVLGRRVVPRLVSAGHDVTAVARSEASSDRLRQQGATPIGVDLFDRDALLPAISGHDVVAHLATNIPTGASALARRGWRANDRLRRDAAAALSSAAITAGAGTYLQESITFPYVDGGDEWIDETHECTYFWGNQTTVDAEAAAASVTSSGGAGIVLRFAMFMADDSAHMQTFAAMAKRHRWGLFGDDGTFVSFIHVDDAASAVVAAIDAPAGVYNVAEPQPTRRGDHRAALAAAVGRSELKSLPGVIERVGGDSAESLARSHRISSTALRDAAGWTAQRSTVDAWKGLA